MAKELPTEEQETVELLFLKLEGEMKSWEREQKLALNAKVVNIVSAAPQHAAYKKHKINPYIAGGAADGIFGPVAGVIAATDNMVRNDQIDAARAEADRNVIESGIKAQMAARVADAARKKVNDIAIELDRHLLSLPSVIKNRQKALDECFESAKALVLKPDASLSELQRAQKLLEECGEYKTARQVSDHCSKRIADVLKKQKKDARSSEAKAIGGVTAVMTFVIGLFMGDVALGAFAAALFGGAGYIAVRCGLLK